MRTVRILIHRFFCQAFPGVRASVPALLVLVFAACSGNPGPQTKFFSNKEAPESKAGERLFREIRFSKRFQSLSGGQVNGVRVSPEPVLRTIPRPTLIAAAHPFAGQTMSCASCHMVDDAAHIQELGMRTYADFATRTQIPDIADGLSTTLRNTPALVGATMAPADQRVLHYDGEFNSPEDLVLGSFSGRNFGWTDAEKSLALDQIVRVVRADDGTDSIARKFGSLPYGRLFESSRSDIPMEYKLPDEFRLTVNDSTSDQMILDQVAKLVAGYLSALRFSMDSQGYFSGSPYDLFLARNGLPRGPDDGESDFDYAQRLSDRVLALTTPTLVSSTERTFVSHDQAFKFDQAELRGLKVFLRKTTTAETSGQVGNCVSCHVPPNFSDFKFHTTGVSQIEYDGMHGVGGFLALSVPSFGSRSAADITRFRSVQSASAPDHADLGVWGTLSNSDIPNPQTKLQALLCKPGETCTPSLAEQRSLAAFKTSGLRDLGHSYPYFHNGSAATLHDSIEFYRTVSNLARSSQLRNASTEMSAIDLSVDAARDLEIFLQALNEDYE